MMQFPIWVWVVSVLGVIGAGIGLGKLLIFLFWRIERAFYPEVSVRESIKPEVKLEEPVEQLEPIKEQPLEEESDAGMEQEIIEKIAPIMPEAIPSEQNRFVKFTYVLQSKFNHPFKEANTIVCWDLALRNGDEVRDAEGKQMKLQVTKPKSEAEPTRYLLVEKGGHHTISVIPGKEYLKRETKLDFDKMKMTQ